MTSDGTQSGPLLRVSIVDADGRALRVPGLAGWLARVAPRRARGPVTIAIVSDRRVRTLNAAYRGIDRATDVLSFPSRAAGSAARSGARSRRIRLKPDPSNGSLGDIVIARGVAARQARDAGHALSTELRVLALHGLLHLLGHDHEQDDGAMARLEARLRRRGGLDAGLIERERAR